MMKARVTWQPELLRFWVGAIFAYMGWMHWRGGMASAAGFSHTIAGLMQPGAPFPWYAKPVGAWLLAVPGIAGSSFTFGLVALGLAEALGLFTRPALMVGAFASVNVFLMGGRAGNLHYDLNSLMFVVQLALLGMGAGRAYSVDALRRAALALAPHPASTSSSGGD